MLRDIQLWKFFHKQGNPISLLYKAILNDKREKRWKFCNITYTIQKKQEYRVTFNNFRFERSASNNKQISMAVVGRQR